MIFKTIISYVTNDLLGRFQDIVDYFNRNPKVLVSLLFLFVLLFAGFQYNRAKTYKTELIKQEKKYERETNRFSNNIRALNDSVTYHKKEGLLVKRLLEITKKEKEVLSKELISAYNVMDSLLRKTNEGDIDIESIFITEFNEQIITDEASTKVTTNNNQLHITLSDTNLFFNMYADTYLTISPDTSNKIMKVNLSDYFGVGKSTQIIYNFDFKLALTKYRTQDNAQRVAIKFLDNDGVIVTDDFLKSVLIEGASFVDVTPVKINTTPNKRKRFGLTVGPSYVLNINNGSLAPGVGITFGYHIF